MEPDLNTTILIVAGMLFVLGMTAILLPYVGKGGAGDILRLFTGYRMPPAMVALARRAATLLIGFLLFRYGPSLGFEEFADRAVAGLSAGGIVEAFWGGLDQIRKPNQNDQPPES